MSYIEEINQRLTPFKDDKLNKQVLDLFAGCGGLSLGFEANGFSTIGYEMERSACETYSQNLHGKCHQIKLDPSFDFPNADVLIGGPPCQPFSVGGKQLGLKDSRDGFPIFLSALEKANPEVFLFENVRGMMYKNKWYLQEVVEAAEALGYTLQCALLNAVNYETPQRRERVIVIGGKKPVYLPGKVNRTISSGEALGELAYQFDSESRFLSPSMDNYVAKYERASSCITPRDLHLDKPARTLTCRNLAGATGDMHRIRLSDGRRRRLTVREAARLQSFPDWFVFSGNATQQFNQIGNAVAPMFAYHLARTVRNYFLPNEFYDGSVPENTQLKLFDNGSVYQSRKV